MKLTSFHERKGKSDGIRDQEEARAGALAFKLAVVEQVPKGELIYKQAREQYGIQGRSMVLVWLRKHGRQNLGPMAHDGRMSVRSPIPSSQKLTPEQRIKELEVQLKEAREKSKFFEAVIDVLKKDYGVRVVKSLWASSLRKSPLQG